MKLRTLVIVVAILALASGAVFFLRRPTSPPSADVRIGKPLVDSAMIEKTAKIQVSDQGKSVSLARQPDGTWIVGDYFGLPADFTKLSRLVDELTQAKVERLVTANAERIAGLEFKDTQLAFADVSGNAQLTLTLGKTAQSGGRFIRFGDEQKAYLAPINAWIDAEPRNWANTQLLNLKPDEVAKVEISFPADGNATIVASRAKKEDAFAAEKSAEGKSLKSDKVSGIVSSLSSLRFSDTADLGDPNVAAARENSRTIKLTTFDGKTVTITAGRKPEQKIIKPPATAASDQSGPAALLKTTKTDPTDPAGDKHEGPAKSLESATETIPAGPVFVFVSHSDPAAPVNALMQKRAFSVYEYAFTSLPQKRDELFEAAPATAPSDTTP